MKRLVTQTWSPSAPPRLHAVSATHRRPAMAHGGIEGHNKHRPLGLSTEAGAGLHPQLPPPRERLVAVWAGRPQAGLLREASLARAWGARCGEAVGHAGMVAAPPAAPLSAPRRRRVKTERRAAAALAHAWRLGADRPAPRTAAAQRPVRGGLPVRAAWVRSRPRGRRGGRARRRPPGARLRRGGPAAWGARGAARALPAVLPAAREPRGRARPGGKEPGAAVAPQTAPRAQAAAGGPRFRPAPGGGPLTARAFGAPVAEGARGAKAPHGARALGLVPREGSAGEPPPRGTLPQPGRGPRRALGGAAWRRGGRQAPVGRSQR